MDLHSPLLRYYCYYYAAAAAAAVVLWWAWRVLDGGRFWRNNNNKITTNNNKNLPPVGCHVQSLLQSFMGGTVPAFFLSIFRSGAAAACLGVAGIGGGFFVFGRRGYLVGNHVVARAILDHPQTIKWKQGFQVLVDTTCGMNVVAEAHNGRRWKHVRKSTAQAFSHTHLERMKQDMEHLIQDWVRTTIPTSTHHHDDDVHQPLDILTEMSRLTARIICRVAFAYDMNEEECDAVLASLSTCWYEFSQMALSNPLRQLPTRWLFPGTWKGRRAALQLFAFGEKVLNVYRRRVAAESNRRQRHLLIDMIDRDSDYANDRERVSDLLAFVVAGFDTNANTLAFCFRELAKNPHEQDKLRAALLACRTDDERRNCPQLRNVVREVLRMFPPVANGSLRITKADIPIPNSSCMIPANSIVIMPFYVIQRNPDVFENPDTFQPSRWENPTESMLQAYIPFSTGRRNCQGQALAHAELYCILSRVLLDYEFRIVEEGTTTAPVLMQPKGLLVSAHPIVRTRMMIPAGGTAQRTAPEVHTTNGWSGLKNLTQITASPRIARA